MLVLTRKANEAIVIIAGGQLIEVAVLNGSCSARTKIGVKAPDDVLVHRKEVWEQIKESGS